MLLSKTKIKLLKYRLFSKVIRQGKSFQLNLNPRGQLENHLVLIIYKVIKATAKELQLKGVNS